MVAQDYVPTSHKYVFKKANELFEDYAYQDALDMYKQLLSNNYSKPEVKLQVAECYRHLNNPRKAAQYYGQVIPQEQISSPEFKFYYADALFKIGKYQQARTWLEKYKQEAPNDERVMEMIKAMENYSEFYRDSSLYEIERLKINSPESDFGPSYFEDGIVFASARKDAGIAQKKYKRDNSVFLDLYFVKQKPDSSLGAVSSFSSTLNSKYHESTTVFFEDQQKVIFTRNNYNQKKLLKSSTGDVNLKLYTAQRAENGDWTNIQELPFNNNEYSVGHAAISGDGNTIYFVSDKPGGYGGTDLYFSEYVNNSWSEPQNLGQKINTKGREMFPFWHEDGHLYFASDGHYGMGGLDIYRWDLQTEELTNLGYPINTQWDDFAFINDAANTSGFFSSNREGGKGGDDIYLYYHKFVNLVVEVIDEDNDRPLPGAKVTLYQAENVYQQGVANELGMVLLKVSHNENYKIEAANSAYTSKFEDISTNENLPGESVRLKYSLTQFHTIEGKSIAFIDSLAIPNADITVVDELNGDEQAVQSDSTGRFSVDLLGTQRYTFVGKSGDLSGLLVGYRPSQASSEEVQIMLDDEVMTMEDDQVETLDDKAKTALLSKGVRITGPIEIENIYYEFDRSEIIQDAANELDKIVKIMQDNPTMKIQLSSHTDARGHHAYNQSLSERRAKSAVAYIVSKGIESGRVISKGYGESKLLNHCDDTADCSEEEHQENRRTEFEVLEF